MFKLAFADAFAFSASIKICVLAQRMEKQLSVTYFTMINSYGAEVFSLKF
jgi:hypothetical protein